MWHEARRQEKLLRSTMIDQSKRAERKRRYFENVRKDPEQFMQVHGRKAHVHADLSIARAAEDSNILRPWQGDPSITIDRFDVRSHLSKMDLMEDDDDIIPKKKQESTVDEKEQIVTDFERYRVLIINDYKGVTEKQYLRKITEREFYHVEKEHSKRLEAEKKKKSAEKKSTIGFSYEDSEVVKGNGKKDASDEESEEEIDELQDLDVDLNTAHLNPETQRVVNKSGEEFGVKRGLFCALLRADQQALRDAAQLKQIDRQKAQLSGRESKHERMLLRQQRQAIVGKGLVVGENGATATLLGFINQSQKKSKIDEMMEDLEGSDDEDDRRAKPEFITTFGGAADRDSDEEVKKSSVGPELPSEEYRKILKLSKNRGNDEEKVDWGSLKAGGGSGDRRMSRRSRTRSPPGRSRSRSRSRSRDRYRRRRSRSRDRRRSRSRDRRRSRSRSKRRSRSRDRNRRSHRRSTSRRRRSTSRRRNRSRSRSRDRRRSRERREKPKDERKKETERRKDKPLEKKDSGVELIFPEPSGKPVEQGPERKEAVPIIESSAEESAGEDIKMLEIRSSMSDSEKERIEIEKRKRRVKLTKKMVKEKKGITEDRSSDEEDEETLKKKEMARRVKMQMNQALKKTRQDLAKEEEDRKREAELAQRVREELRYIELQERREREKAKQRKADESSNSP